MKLFKVEEREMHFHRLALITRPDETIRWVCPGVGIVVWEYHHHGPVSDYRVELVSFILNSGE
jgi:hypothetical protein